MLQESALNRAEAVMKSLEGSHLKRDRTIARVYSRGLMIGMAGASLHGRLARRVTRVSSQRQLQGPFLFLRVAPSTEYLLSCDKKFLRFR